MKNVGGLKNVLDVPWSRWTPFVTAVRDYISDVNDSIEIWMMKKKKQSANKSISHAILVLVTMVL